jgi:putative tricarboxylic transport membrane protein
MKSRQDLLFEIKVSVFLLVFALVYVILTLVGIDTSGRFLQGNAGLDPTTFPYFIGIVFTGTAFYLLVKSIYQYRLNTKKENTDAAKGIGIPVVEKKPFPFPVKASLVPYIAFIVYIATLRLFGFILDSVLLSIVILFYLNQKNRMRNIIFAIVFPVFVFLLFNKVLDVRLPIGYIFGAKY